MLFYENWEALQNINFAEQRCATVSGFLWHFHIIYLHYYWWIISVIAWRYISIMWATMLVVYCYISIILVSILVLYYYYYEFWIFTFFSSLPTVFIGSDISQTSELKFITKAFSASYFDGLCSYLHSSQKHPAVSLKINAVSLIRNTLAVIITNLLKQGLTFSSNTF